MNKIALASAVLLAAGIAACGGGGGSSPAPKPLTATSAPAVTSITNGVMPAGTVGVTLTIKIPQHTKSTAVVRFNAKAKRTPKFIQATTDGITVTVTPAVGNAMQVTGTCTPAMLPTSCTVVVPIPVAYASTLLAQLTQGGTPIGQATASYTAGQFQEGVASTAPTLTFQPLIGTIVVTWDTSVVPTPAPFVQGTASANFGAQILLLDEAGNDVGNETDGALDLSGNLITQLTVNGSGVNGVGFPYTINMTPGNPASDISISTNALAYDGVTSNPDISVTVSGGGSNFYGIDPLSTAGGYFFTPHGLAFTSGDIEYPSDSYAYYNVGTDTLSLNENISNDGSGGITVSTSGACAAITSFGGTVLSPGVYTFNVPYLSPPYSGTCTITAIDSPQGNTAQININITQTNITVQGKNRRK